MDSASKSLLSSSEVAFPRGGASVLTPLEVKTISNKATEDVLFEQANDSKKRVSSTASQPSKKRKKQKKKDDTDTEEKSIAVEHFTFKNMIPGSSVLGQIVRIDKVNLTLTFGDNLLGQIPITAISKEVSAMIEKYEASQESDDESDDEGSGSLNFKPEFPKLNELFTIGQWLRAQVTPSDEKTKRITLSIEPKVVNASVEEDDLTTGNILQASVKSVEDHGIILDFGHDEFSGFISKKELKKAEIDPMSLKVGRVILVSVISKNNSIVSVRLAENENVSKKSTITTITSIDAIHPGAVVNAIITEVSNNGISARLFGLVDGSFSLPHAEEFSLEKLKNHFGVGSTVRARVIGILTQDGTKKFVLSKSSKVIALEPVLNKEPLEAFPTGFVINNVEVIGSDDSYIYVSMGSSSIKGQVHKSQTDPELDIDVNYRVGTKHEARVLRYSEIDNMLLLTLNPKAVKSKFVSAEDIPVGEYIPSVEVTKILPDGKGIIVKIFGDFEALVPPTQMSDIKLVYPERKFKVGSKVKGRVLFKAGKKLFVTLRKSLVNMDDDAIASSIDNLSVGFKTSGIVDRFIPGGALISFFGSLKAYLPKNEISETFVENAKDYLKESQAVSVRVLSVKPLEGKVSVTLRQATELSNKQIEHLEEIEIGRTIVDATIAEKAKESIIVELEGSNLRGIIATGQLSDGNYEENRIIYKSLKIGGTIEVVILEKDFRARAVIASAKRSLVNAAKTETLPVHYEDVHVGNLVSGYIKSVTSMGLFVSFAGKLTGLVLAKNATEDPTEDLSSKFYKYQSVACSVIKTEDENKRFMLALSSTPTNKVNATSKLKNPVDQSMKTVSDFSVGVSTSCVVESIEPGYLNVRLADNLFGRIEALQCVTSWSDIKNPKNPLASFSVGKNLKAKVIGYFDTKAQKFSAAATFNKETVIELSILKKEIKSKLPYKPQSLSDIDEGSEHVVFIESYSHGVANVSLSPNVKAQIPVYALSANNDDYKNFDTSFPLGTALRANVTGFDFQRGKAILSARSEPVESVSDLELNEKYPAKVFKIAQAFVLVELAPGVVGYSYITDALNDYDQKLEETYKQNQAVLVTITELDKKENKFSVSLRDEEKAKDKPVNSIDEIKRGDLAKGFIKSINANGLYVSLGRELYALVRVSDISDAFLSDWKKFFKPYQAITGKISQCKAEGRILMTLKESEVNGDLTSFRTFEELEEGQNYDGSVKKVHDFGVFVKLDGTANISGLCHRSEIADTPVESVEALFGEGDRVKVKILKIDNSKKQLSLGMKASYFTDLNDEDVDMEADSESEEDSEDEVMEDAFDEEKSDSEDEEDDNKEKAEAALINGLSTNGFDWTASILDQADDNLSSSDEEDFTEIKRKKKKGKKQVQDRTGEMNSRAPQSIGDFERLLVGNPDSSVLWMNYMSFQLQLGEIDKSREIAERALKTINYREEQEKMNIWIALLNLENSFGTDESLDETFKRSVQYMDSLTMHQKLIGIYQLSEKFDKADDLYKDMTKKFSREVSVWVQYGSSLMDRQLNDEAHALLARALQSLPKRDHIDVVRKFGQLEFSKGDAEQGRSLFEGLVTDAPKRIDLWNVYIDQEIKFGDKEKVESLFERVITKKLSRKQAKFFFSKWLSFEEENGTEHSASRVKALAVDYVQNQSKDEE
ncbi:CIC11C00000000250 [Sungouiella intermedia]|uniref:rRNA biogenesis protein RRP5 n=1 Tax=Sungouiella intermedia TaxID=45354 RepID=A0A1L0D8T5_9ASCO|nr:CIC11C00000000250 [[Candida] intermedia]